jgi:hypothetical protein
MSCRCSSCCVVSTSEGVIGVYGMWCTAEERVREIILSSDLKYVLIAENEEFKYWEDDFTGMFIKIEVTGYHI